MTTADVEAARNLGATDLEIHDTVLIAAAFCMYNRYVDGLGTEQPDDEALYRERGRRSPATATSTPARNISAQKCCASTHLVCWKSAILSEASLGPRERYAFVG